MADFTQALFRLDPTKGFVDYVSTIKPYHSKLMEVLVEYVYTEKVNTTVRERWNWTMTFSEYGANTDVLYSCGYGYRWDAHGLKAPEAVPTSLIVSATAKFYIDVATTAGSSDITVVRNVAGHALTINDPVVFEPGPDLPVGIEGGRTYFVTSVSPTLQISEMVGGTPIVFTDTVVTKMMPQGLPYNTFLVRPSLATSSYPCLVTSGVSNQFTFVDSYDLTNVDTANDRWYFRVGTWTVGSGYTPGTYTGITLLGGVGSGTDATCSIVVGSTGQVQDVAILDAGTKAYATGDVLTVAPGAIGPGVGFAFTVTKATVFELGKITPGQNYTPGVHTGVTLVGGSGAGTDAVATITVSAVGEVALVTVTQKGTKTYYEGEQLTAVIPGGTGFSVQVTRAERALTLPLVEDDVIYINGNSSPIANGKYTVDTVNGSYVQVKEDIPPLANATGSLYVGKQFMDIPYWPSGTKVQVTATGDMPSPLSSAGIYYFIPSTTIGVFNLATKRYPLEIDDFVDIVSIGNQIEIRRVEPFSPGDYVKVHSTHGYLNDGNYIVSTVEPEGSNFRVSVLQSTATTASQ